MITDSEERTTGNTTLPTKVQRYNYDSYVINSGHLNQTKKQIPRLHVSKYQRKSYRQKLS